MAISNRRLGLTLLLILTISFCSGCGGGGGGGSSGGPDLGFNGGSWQSDFFVADVLFGRPLIDTKGLVYQVVNPASYIELDPITGFLIAGYPKTLYPNDEMGNLWSLNLVDTPYQPFKPKIIPRNAVFIVEFSQPVDPATLLLDADNLLTAVSPVQLKDKLGRSVPIQANALGNQLILSPVTGDNVGFPASPLIFNEGGIPISDNSGFMRLTFTSIGAGAQVLKSSAGLELGERADGLGTVNKPIGFNPGNQYLDFISFGEMTFNGFLPDLTPPRLIREVAANGTVDSVNLFGSDFIIGDSTAGFNVSANGGQGEWAQGILTLRPGDPFEAKVRVTTNNGTEFTVAQSEPGFVYGDPAVGDDYLVQRVEYFEPIPGFDRPETAIDPVNHPKDIDDPEDAFNSDLIRFLSFDEWDGNNWIPETNFNYADPDHLISASYRISLQFSEPMDVGSFRPLDSFYVADAIGDRTDPLFDVMKIGRVTSANRQTKIFFEPVYVDQFGLLGGDQFVGFGKLSKTLRFVIRAIPSSVQLEAFYESLGDPGTWPEAIIPDLDAEGVLGVTDLGGQSLGMPTQFFDKADNYCLIHEDSPGRGPFPPAVDYLVSLSSLGDPLLLETGLIAHRFMGLPETAADPDKGITGVVYRDHDDKDGDHSDNEIYGPCIADVSVGLSGFLSGHPVEFIEHVFDDHNPPSRSSPSDPDPISKTPFGAGTPINASFGVRFQQVYRRGEASPDVPSFEGTVLDLIGLSWSPIGGNVTHTYIKELQIAMCLFRGGINLGQSTEPYEDPDTRENGGIPKGTNSGLDQKFDSYRGTWGPNGDYPNPDNFKEENSPISSSNVWDTDGDGSLRDEWNIVIGSPIDYNKFHGLPNPEPYTDGRSYIIDQSNMYAPKNQGSKFNLYLSYPAFDNPSELPGYGYDSSRGLLIDIRTDDNGSTPVALTNGYSFHVGIQSSMLPRFRAYCRAGPAAYRTSIFAATDPYDVVNPPMTGPPNPVPDDPRSWHRAWPTMLSSPGNYGDNSRYFMIFNYAKRVSTVESPLIRVQPSSLMRPKYLAPIIDPPLSDIPLGTKLHLWFRASQDEDGFYKVTDWFPHDQISNLNGDKRPFVQFKATFEANLETGEIPIIDSIVIPYRE